jgi:hypothetical protein
MRNGREEEAESFLFYSNDFEEEIRKQLKVQH